MLRAALIASTLALTGCVYISVDKSDAEDAPPAVSASPSALPSPVPAHQRQSPWYTDARARVTSSPAGHGAKNVVLFIGDGMGISTITAARILAGQQAGNSGEENRLSFETFPQTGLVKTYNVDSQTADSAGTMSAIMTGVKTDISVFGIDEQVEADNCASGRGHELLSLLDIAELAGAATGVVSTARLTHATPGATYARTANRDWEDDSELTDEARAEGCTDIASQFLAHRGRLNEEFGAGMSDGIEVALGGGKRHFLPESVEGGKRKDGRDLIAQWQAANPTGTFVSDAQGLASTDHTPVLGLFSDSHMGYASQRSAADATQPGLPAMTRKALELLRDRDEGFLLVVEAGRIDHAHHAGNAANALNDTIELAAAVQVVMDETDPEDTLVLVTADHSHVFTMAGYPRRGNPILGKVVPAWSDEPTLDSNGLPYTTLGYMNGRGYRDLGDETNADVTYGEAPTAGRQDLRDVDTTAIGYHQESLVPLSAETHGGEDVAVYARGPGARAVVGVNEQNLLFHVMLSATDWEQRAARRGDKRS